MNYNCTFRNQNSAPVILIINNITLVVAANQSVVIVLGAGTVAITIVLQGSTNMQNINVNSDATWDINNLNLQLVD